MNRIEEMIKEMCPEGVERLNLENCTTIIRGKRVTKKDLIPDGKYPVVSGGTSPMGFINEYNREENTITISQYGTAGYVDFQNQKFWANDVCYSIYPNEMITNRYLWYALKNKQEYLYSIRNTDAVPYSLTLEVLKSIEIPLPPLPIQQEIVKILDSFTSLQQTLEDELKLRQKQYEFYRDFLFSEDVDTLQNRIDCEVKTIGELGTLTRGKRFVRTDIVEQGVPCIHYGDMYTYYGLKAEKANTHITREKAKSMRFAKKGDVVVVGAGENDWDIGVGLVWLGEEDAAIHDACYILEHKQNPMYISHFLRSTVYHLQLRKYVSSGKISSFSAKDIAKIYIPIPSLQRQQEIVSILDTFESLITNLKKEIEARKKQYEYYREQLLTFE